MKNPGVNKYLAQGLAILPVLALLLLAPVAQAQIWTLGMSSERTPIQAYGVPARISDASSVLVIGGLSGDIASNAVVRAGYEAYVNESENYLDVAFVSSANPHNEALQFPPTGRAYRDNPVSHSLWRWIASHAPDRVIIVGLDEYGLTEALEQDGVLDVGTIEVESVDYENELVAALRGRKSFPPSPAALTLERREERGTEEVADALADVYGQDFDALTYIPGMALIGRLRRGELDAVEALAARWLEADGDYEITSSLHIAGHLVFAELAERTGDEDYLDLARRAADLGFDEAGNPREAMPLHNDLSDAFFMATPLLAKVGKLTGERRYFDLALNHVEYLHDRLLRRDGLYNHSPAVQAAWGRGNAFPALGLALALSDIPEDHPAHERLLTIYQAHMSSLLNHMDVDGMWRNIINMPGTYQEFSATAMIATAMQRGIEKGWLESFYQGAVDRAWQALLLRTDREMGFIDVCESTPAQDSLQAYLHREALLGPDDRAGGMFLMLATERLAAGRE